MTARVDGDRVLIKQSQATFCCAGTDELCFGDAPKTWLGTMTLLGQALACHCISAGVVAIARQLCHHQSLTTEDTVEKQAAATMEERAHTRGTQYARPRACIICTSAEQLNTGTPSGAWLSEVLEPYFKFADAGLGEF